MYSLILFLETFRFALDFRVLAYIGGCNFQYVGARLCLFDTKNELCDRIVRIAKEKHPGVTCEACFLAAVPTYKFLPIRRHQHRSARISVPQQATHLAAGFELNQKRLEKTATPQARITDNLSQWGIVVGNPVPVPVEWLQWLISLIYIVVTGSSYRFRKKLYRFQ